MRKAARGNEATPGTGTSTVNIAEQRFIPFMQDDEYLFIDYPATTREDDVPEFPGETLDQDVFMREITSVMDANNKRALLPDAGEKPC